MKSYLFRFRILFWLATIVIAFGLSCRPQAEPETHPDAEAGQEPAETNSVEVKSPAEADTNSVGLKQPVEADVRDSNSVAVTVNGVDITEGRVEARLKPQLEKMAAQLPPAFVEQYKKQLRQQAIEGMIVEQLLNEEVKKANIVVTEEEVADQLKEMASQQNLSLEDLKDLMNAYGKSFDELKQRIRKGLGYQRLMEAQWAGKVNVTVEDANSYYTKNQKQFETPEQVRASHILIKPDTSDPNTDPNQARAAAKAKAEELLKQIKDGADVATLARENSGCPSAAKGGDLSLFGRGQMTPAFEKAAFALDVNEVSDVVETQFGYHIIKLTDHEDPSTLPFEQAKADILKLLTQKKQGEIAEAHIESLKAHANIVYSPGKELK